MLQEVHGLPADGVCEESKVVSVYMITLFSAISLFNIFYNNAKLKEKSGPVIILGNIQITMYYLTPKLSDTLP